MSGKWRLIENGERRTTRRKTVLVIIATLLFASIFGLASGSRLVKAETCYYYNLTIIITPESPTIDDEVYVTVSFATASASYIVSFYPGFITYISITVPDIVRPEMGYVEKTLSLGKLLKGSYIFSVNVLVCNYEGQELLGMWHEKSFTVGAIRLPVLAVPEVIDENLVPGSIFRINVTVDDVEKLWGYEFALWYDTAVLSATSYGSYPPFNTHQISGIDDAEGWVALAFFTFMGDNEGFSTISRMPIAWIDFRVDSVGASMLDFFYHSELDNIFGYKIPHEQVNGFFDNRLTVVMANVDITPDTLNLKSLGKWITTYIELPKRYDANNIDVSTITLNDTFSVDSNAPMQVSDHDIDGVPDLMVKFHKTQLQSYIYHVLGLKHSLLTLKICGKLCDGTPFEGFGTVFVKYAGDANNGKNQ